jgi:hypothetical protein
MLIGDSAQNEDEVKVCQMAEWENKGQNEGANPDAGG